MTTFSPCQDLAMRILTEGQDNVFLTGCAGSGKSFLVKQFLRNKDRKAFPVVASTGAAAVLVGGRTFHSFFGLGMMDGGFQLTVERALGNRRVVNRLRKIDGFVLDEVSMISGETLRTAELICREARQNLKPWGGARVIAVGDFAQLPPVSRFGGKKDWAFLDDVWERSEFTNLLLKTILRTQDVNYTTVLNYIRNGIVNDEVECYLNRKTDPDYEPEKVAQTTHLFPRRDVVDGYNRKRLAEIPKELKQFPTRYVGKALHVEQLKRNAPIPDVLQIKESALVMTRTNDAAYRFVNGSLGQITTISDDAIGIRLKNGREIELEPATFSLQDADGKEIASATNFPIVLAYATTIHKAQGATLDEMLCDLRNLWEPGQAYVALSRLRSGAGLMLAGWDEASIRVDPNVSAFYERLTSNS